MRPSRHTPLPELAHLTLLSYDRFIPVYFEKDIDGGAPQLTARGRKAIEEELTESPPYPPETAPTESA